MTVRGALPMMVYHDESVENDFFRVLGQREVAHLWLVVLNVPLVWFRLRTFSDSVIDLATAALL